MVKEKDILDSLDEEWRTNWDKKIKLNIGCGLDIKEGWENYDMYPADKRVKYINLLELPLSLPDNHADFVLLSHVLEHMVHRKEFMHEISRILKPDGLSMIILPGYHFSMDHHSCFHGKGYLGTVCHGLSKNDAVGHAAPRPFVLVKFKADYESLIGFLRNIVQWIKILSKRQVHFVIKNNKQEQK